MNLMLEIIGSLCGIISIVMIVCSILVKDQHFFPSAAIYAGLMSLFMIAAALWTRIDIVERDCKAVSALNYPTQIIPYEI